MQTENLTGVLTLQGLTDIKPLLQNVFNNITEITDFKPRKNTPTRIVTIKEYKNKELAIGITESKVKCIRFFTLDFKTFYKF